MRPEGAERRSTSPAGRRRRALFDVLRAVERETGSGVLRFAVGTEEVGAIVVQDGLVCFADARPAPDLPEPDESRADAEARAELASVALRAQEARTSLRAAIFEGANGAAERLCHALRLETVRALRTLAQWNATEAVGRWLDATAPGYDRRLTFVPADLFVAVLGVDEPAGRTGTMDLFDGFRASSSRGLLLSREPGLESVPYPIACHGFAADATLQDLMVLTRFAGELMRPTAVIGGTTQPTYASLRDDTGSHWVCVGRDRHLALIERAAGVDPTPVIAHSMRLQSA